MQSHLSTGCTECRLTADLLLRATQTGIRERAFDIPPALLRSAIDIFPAPPESALFRLPSLAARLIFNSFTDPLPAGARSVPQSTHQLLYEIGDYAVDLHLSDPSANQDGPVGLAGQILNRKMENIPLRGVPVYLVLGTRVIDRNIANELGEFILDFSPRRNLRLRVPLPAEGTQIDIPLHHLIGMGERRA